MNAQHALAERAVAYACADVSAAMAQQRLDQVVADAARRGHTVHTHVDDTEPVTVPLHMRRGWSTVVGTVEAGLADAVIVRSMSDLAAEECDRIPILGWLQTTGARLVTLGPPDAGIPRSAPGRGAPQTRRAAAGDGHALQVVRAFAATPSSVHLVRQMIRRCLTVGIRVTDACVVDDACLLTDELLANAIVHGCSSPADTITVTVECNADRVQISVSDPSHRMPRPCSPAANAESGRGLRLVTGLAAQWGVTTSPSEPGKRVWFALRRPERGAAV
ncbi:ATP-binding protein [Streptomyces sp. Go40/10]|uniref:ATP-binding protein n=1 Tax=Streptomyces sp. Go40/10 TaxID=2825844 RepID=UPI001E44074E|nr:ATP-binding protein [Streptomyces sp. Go40/10]UFQ99777.1 ATP-binding protein [Streptomyces sp. Go40/10]